jgi:hypothetical protein
LHRPLDRFELFGRFLRNRHTADFFTKATRKLMCRLLCLALLLGLFAELLALPVGQRAGDVRDCALRGIA